MGAARALDAGPLQFPMRATKALSAIPLPLVVDTPVALVPEADHARLLQPAVWTTVANFAHDLWLPMLTLVAAAEAFARIHTVLAFWRPSPVIARARHRFARMTSGNKFARMTSGNASAAIFLKDPMLAASFRKNPLASRTWNARGLVD